MAKKIPTPKCHKCGKEIVFMVGMYFLDYIEMVDGIPVNAYGCQDCSENIKRHTDNGYKK